ncbi:MAG: tRNA epoxyqueuosine(34) reductase QueG [Rhizobiales bacterium]|nr:tRNA epoxyqueuosine(34) reductase QueG [Hyphomicrobiales bacterium]
MPTSISERLRARASQEGFSGIRIASADAGPEQGERLRSFLEKSYHGEMDWLAETAERRVAPRALWPEARSAIMLAMSYGQGLDAFERLERKSQGVISVYALNRDYHDVVKGKLKKIATWFASATKSEVKVFVDTAPLMEKPLAHRAGLGWQGKHTNLVSRELGSWFFIGTILTDRALPKDDAETDHCGSCRACLDICPTKAFPAPYQLDARRCISYLTIEHKGHIDREFRKPMGNRIYGCDDCLAVCPWNKFASEASEAKLRAREDLVAPGLDDLAQLDDAGFRKLFVGSPVKRLGRDRFVRNVLIAIGNSGNADFIPVAQHLLGDASPLVRAMAVWALRQLMPHDDFRHARDKHEMTEPDLTVKAEWSSP